MQKRQIVTSGEFTIIQSEFNNNVIIMKNGKIIKNVSCEKRLSENELKKFSAWGESGR